MNTRAAARVWSHACSVFAGCVSIVTRFAALLQTGAMAHTCNHQQLRTLTLTRGPGGPRSCWMLSDISSCEEKSAGRPKTKLHLPEVPLGSWSNGRLSRT